MTTAIIILCVIAFWLLVLALILAVLRVGAKHDDAMLKIMRDMDDGPMEGH